MAISTEFCNSPLWDYNLAWNASSPDFTPCFQSTVLVWTPFLTFLFLSPLEVLQAYHSKKRSNPWSKISFLKLALNVWLIVLAFVRVVSVSYVFGKSKNSGTTISDLMSPLLDFIAYALVVAMALYIRRKGTAVSKVLSLFWLLQSLSLLIRMYTSFLHDECKEYGREIECLSQTVLRIVFPTVFIQLILSSFVETTSNYELLDDDLKDNCQIKSASLFSCLFFTWMTGLVFKGGRKKLQSEDLPLLCKDMAAYELGKKFDIAFRESSENNSNPVQQGNEDNVRVISPSRSSLLLLLLKISWWPFLLSTIIELLYICFSVLPPFMLKYILLYVQTSEESWHGYMYALGFYFTVMIKSVTDNMCQYFSSVASISIQSSLSSAIYKKLFRFDYSGKKQYTAGEIANLISVDTWEIIMFTNSISSLWGIPLQIGIAFYFLWQILGIASLGSFAVILILSPLSMVIGKYTETLQTKIMTKKDERMKIMSEIFNGIKVLKLYAWEKPFMKRVQIIREVELHALKISVYVYSFFTFLWTSAPDLMMLVCFALYTFINTSVQLNVEIIFVSLSFITLLHIPLTKFPSLVYSVVRANVSYKRISEFLYSSEINPNTVGNEPESGFAITFEDATYSWSFEKEPELHNIKLKIPKGSLTAVVGSVGCGKSSLLSAVIGIMKKRSGEIHVEGSIGYVAQQAWIQNNTLRNNILFVKDMDERFYRKIIKACALTDDLEILPGRDSVEIGEKGINLSGGQKQRVSLARAVYQDCDVYLLDDPLSAVDANVASHLFDKVIGPTGMLKTKTRVLATHNIAYLAKVDNIVMMEDGKIVEEGTYFDLMGKKGNLYTFLQQHLSEKEIERDCINDSKKAVLERNISVISNYDEKIDEKTINENRLTEDERTEYGGVKWQIYKGYIRKIGVPVFIITVFGFFATCCSQTASGLWLSYWSTDSSSGEKRDMFLGVYGGIVGFSAILNMVAYGIFFFGCVRASIIIHNELLTSVLKSPLSFFDTTPVGRILNRFSQDIESMDQMMPFMLSMWFIMVFYIVLLLAIISYANVYVVAVVVAISVFYLYILKVYIYSSNQLQRLDSISRSPIYSNFSETLSGVSTIRAFGAQNYFFGRCNTHIDENLKCHYFNQSAGRWLDCLLSIISGFIILGSALAAVFGKDTMNAGLIGLVLNYCVQISDSLSWGIKVTSQLENEVVSLERLDEYSKLTSEAEWDIDTKKPPLSWPTEGNVEFDNFSVRYRDGLDPVLKDVNLKIEPTTKIGIVGRTGAGKSSLILSIFRIMEPASGKITIDGIDISTLGLYDLRSRLTVIPQDPVLFAGTLRINLDPWDERTDDEIWESLNSAHLKSFVSTLSDGLMYEISEGGGNLSAGQKQLICLARALLRRTKILILDEATASVDLETDQMIQATIREAFSNCTIITIAHRINTIMDYDKIVVLSQGQVVEEGSPEILLQNVNSHFYNLAKDANLV